MARLRDGTRMLADPRSYIERELLLLGGFDWPVFRATVGQAKRGDVYDVGANVGALSIPWASAQADPETHVVVAMEPLPELRARMLVNASLNNITNLIARDEAAGSSPEKRKLYPPQSGTSNLGKGSFSRLPGLGADGMDVDVVTLDSIREEREQGPALIKIDVEGHEVEVLRGATNLLVEDEPWIVFEHVAETWMHAEFTWDDLKDVMPPTYKFFSLARRRGPRSMVGSPVEGNVLAVPSGSMP